VQGWEWVVERLGSRGVEVVGPVEDVRIRPWSQVRRAPTTAGTVYFKVTCAGSAYEAALVPALAALVPDRVLAALDTDAERGWLLLPDGGRTLREQGLDRAGWAGMFAAYAELQRTVAPSAADLVALGVPDLRPARMPGYLAGFADGTELAEDLRGRLRTLAPEYGRWCAELAADGVPASVQHDDLHNGNVFAGLRFFDWGDACVAHPFTSLLVGLGAAHHQLDLDEAGLAYLRDAYLEPWGLPAASARRSATLAQRVGKVGRALSWQRALSTAMSPIPADVADAVPEWLGALWESDPL
jgi:hypothetical protein